MSGGCYTRVQSSCQTSYSTTCTPSEHLALRPAVPDDDSIEGGPR